MRKSVFELRIDEVRLLASECESVSDILRAMGMKLNSGNFQTLQKVAKENNITLPVFDKKKSTRWAHARITIPLDDILVEDSTYTNSVRLKQRLIRSGHLTQQCYSCGLGPMWNHLPLSLQLDHKNGNRNDNRLVNLRLLCPNCHSQTETFGSKMGQRY